MHNHLHLHPVFKKLVHTSVFAISLFFPQFGSSNSLWLVSIIPGLVPRTYGARSLFVALQCPWSCLPSLFQPHDDLDFQCVKAFEYCAWCHFVQKHLLNDENKKMLSGENGNFRCQRENWCCSPVTKLVSRVIAYTLAHMYVTVSVTFPFSSCPHSHSFKGRYNKIFNSHLFFCFLTSALRDSDAAFVLYFWLLYFFLWVILQFSCLMVKAKRFNEKLEWMTETRPQGAQQDLLVKISALLILSHSESCVPTARPEHLLHSGRRSCPLISAHAEIQTLKQ